MSTSLILGAKPTGSSHAARMDAIYRWQRPIYDVTRKYFLLGRDRLVQRLALDAGGRLLEIGCGTGRNLAVIGRHWPKARLFGIDISQEMLCSARAKLGNHAMLALGDACHLETQYNLGVSGFERVVFSYVLSMIPDWQTALHQGAALLVPGGSLHIVDFGSAEKMPKIARFALRGWLARFDVSVRDTLAEEAAALAKAQGLYLACANGPLGYYRHLVLHRPIR